MFNLDKMHESDNIKNEILMQIEHHIKTNIIIESEFGNNAKNLVKYEMKKFESMTEKQLIAIVNLFSIKNT